MTQFLAGEKNFFLLLSINTGSGGHPAFYPSPGGKLPGQKADHSSPSNARIMNVWSYTSVTV
jgi:hypothetical protein